MSIILVTTIVCVLVWLRGMVFVVGVLVPILNCGEDTLGKTVITGFASFTDKVPVLTIKLPLSAKLNVLVVDSKLV